MEDLIKEGYSHFIWLFEKLKLIKRESKIKNKFFSIEFDRFLSIIFIIFFLFPSPFSIDRITIMKETFPFIHLFPQISAIGTWFRGFLLLTTLTSYTITTTRGSPLAWWCIWIVFLAIVPIRCFLSALIAALRLSSKRNWMKKYYLLVRRTAMVW